MKKSTLRLFAFISFFVLLCQEFGKRNEPFSCCLTIYLTIAADIEPFSFAEICTKTVSGMKIKDSCFIELVWQNIKGGWKPWHTCFFFMLSVLQIIFISSHFELS